MRLVFILCHPTKQQEVSAICKKGGKSELGVIYRNGWREKGIAHPCLPSAASCTAAKNDSQSIILKLSHKPG